MNVQFDFSQATIVGVKEGILLNAGGDKAREWQEGKEHICAMFILGLAPVLERFMQAGNYPEAEFTLIFVPKTFDDDGEVRGDAKIVDREGNVIMSISKINGDAGRWDSFKNLCGEAMTKAGDKVGRLLMREYNKYMRSKW